MANQKKMYKWMKTILTFSAIAYVAIVGLLLWSEPVLVYPGAPASRGNYSPSFDFEDVWFSSADGTKLHGWLLPRKDSKRYLLFCHGNAENVANASQYVARTMQETLDANVFVFDYRGYGKSEGEPFEQGVLEDTEAAMDWICERFSIAPSDVIVNGFSLGGGPATHVATKLGCRGLILQRTYSSMPDVAASKYPFVPVHMLMQNRFESAKKIAGYTGPLLQSHGEADRVIPFKFGEKLYKACPSAEKEFFSKERMGHFSPLDDEFLALVKAFGDKCYEEE